MKLFSLRSLFAAWLFALGALCLAAAPAGAQLTLISLDSFTADANQPQAGLVLGSDGDFYGTTFYGGSDNDGAVFKVSPSGVLTTLYSFTGGGDGANPAAALVLGHDGNFYGTTSQGSSSDEGTVFKITPSGALRTLVDFNGANGASPEAALVLGSDGNFYGTTYSGGSSGDGTVFKMTPAGALSTLVSFTGSDGNGPHAALVLGSDGDFYGTTSEGTYASSGTLFKVTSAGGLTTLVVFTGTSGANLGAAPVATLIQGSDGNFYGTTEIGGASNEGTLFQFNPSSGVLTTLVNFTGDNGQYPASALLQGTDGDFYGTTFDGGSSGDGTVFKTTSTGALTTLVSFTTANGAHPYGALIQGGDGDFYDTTMYGGSGGGPNGDGTVFTVTPTGTLTTLVDFSARNGQKPEAALVLGSDGDYYGTTYSGGQYGDGTVFDVSSSGALTTLYTLGTNNGEGDNPDGYNPAAGLILGSDGNFYGTTSGGGASFQGSVFVVTPSGMLTTLTSFTGGNDGASPEAAPVQGSDGNFYGTTYAGGTNSDGTVFKMTPSGTLTTLYSFPGGNDGEKPEAALVQGSDGNFYGTTLGSDGLSNVGTVFKISSSGTFTTLHTFSKVFDAPPFENGDGANPAAGLVLGSDGDFYGTTYDGGANGNGTVFKISASGTLTTIYNFSPETSNGTANVNDDGAHSYAALILASDGNFYGTAANGGTDGDGTVFKITPSGTLTTLIDFAGIDGAFPKAALVQDRDGNFYGTTEQGGTDGGGTIFGLFGPPTTYGASESTTENTPVSFTVAFDDPSGKGVTSIAFPTEPSHGTLTVGAITEMGGTGTVALTYTPNTNFHGDDSFTCTVTGFVGTSSPQAVTLSVNPPPGPPTIHGFVPGSGPVGTTVTITGTNLIGATSVTFNGLAASFTYVSSTQQIRATVPVGATTGPVSVTAPLGTATSPLSYDVTPPAPTITSFSPTAGVAGTTVTIMGTSFQGTSVVGFNGHHPTSFTVNADGTQITTTVPSGATTGKIAVVTPGGEAFSSTNFIVIGRPTITGFTPTAGFKPTSGTVGTTVTIMGTSFQGTSVVGFNGHHPASFTISADGTQITTTVPSGATTGPIAVITPLGEAFSTMSFTVIGPPTITGFSPTSGSPGAAVTITGTNLQGTSVVGFNGHHPTSFTVSPDGTQITTTVPSGATTGTVGVITPAGETFSSTDFTVIPPPTITSFSPTSGPVGTSVTITGTNFTGASAVGFDGHKAASFTVSPDGTTITTTVPSGAATGIVAVITPSGEARSATNFTVN